MFEKQLHYLKTKKNNQPKDIREERKMVAKTRNRISYAQRLVKRYEKRQMEGEVDPIYIVDEKKKK